MDIDPIKAPRTHAAWKKAYDIAELAKFMVELSQQLECELNESNKIIRQQQLLDEKNLMLEERIKQLEELYEGEIGEHPELLGSNLLGLLKRELNSAQKRIKWLEEAFNAAEGLIAVSSCGCPYGDEVFHCSSCVQAINRYHKAKENKP